MWRAFAFPIFIHNFAIYHERGKTSFSLASVFCLIKKAKRWEFHVKFNVIPTFTKKLMAHFDVGCNIFKVFCISNVRELRCFHLKTSLNKQTQPFCNKHHEVFMISSGSEKTLKIIHFVHHILFFLRKTFGNIFWKVETKVHRKIINLFEVSARLLEKKLFNGISFLLPKKRQTSLQKSHKIPFFIFFYYNFPFFHFCAGNHPLVM